MALQTPTTAEISANIVAQLQASLNQTIPLLPKAFIRVLAKALAGVFTLLYKYGGYMFLNIFVATADNQETEVNGVTLNPLVEWGRLIGIGDPTAATQAEHTVDIPVLTQGGTLPSGSQLVYSGTGVVYITIGDVALSAATVSATIRAAADNQGGDGAGAIGNLDPGAVVSFVNPLSAVGPEATVTAQTVTGADGESTDAYRQRIVDRFQKVPQGGAFADYEIWGESVAGIVWVGVYTGDPGEVNLYCEATPASSGDPDGIPTLAQQQAVLDAVELDDDGLASRRPVTALVNVWPITRLGFDVEVVGLVVDNPAQVQSDITDAVTELMLSYEPFITGLSVLPRRDRITRTAVAGAVEDITTAAGGIFTNVVLRQGAVSIEAYILGEGEKAKASSVTFI